MRVMMTSSATHPISKRCSEAVRVRVHSSEVQRNPLIATLSIIFRAPAGLHHMMEIVFNALCVRRKFRRVGAATQRSSPGSNQTSKYR